MGNVIFCLTTFIVLTEAINNTTTLYSSQMPAGRGLVTAINKLPFELHLRGGYNIADQVTNNCVRARMY